MINPHQAAPPIKAVVFGGDGVACAFFCDTPLLLPERVHGDRIGWLRADGLEGPDGQLRRLPPVYEVEPTTKEILLGGAEPTTLFTITDGAGVWSTPGRPLLSRPTPKG